MKKLLTPTLFLVLFATGAFSQSKDIQQKISAVESHLSGWIRTQNDHDWTLQERMKRYHLKGLSIAVINDYKIEWAKGYGWPTAAKAGPSPPPRFSRLPPSANPSTA